MKFLLLLTLTASALLTHACTLENSKTKAVIGEDTRKASSQYLDFVGKLTSESASCTAFISGPNQITAAAHCLPEDTHIANLVFELQNSRVYPISDVVEFHQRADIVVLASPVGDSHLESSVYSENKKSMIVSYDIDKASLVESVDGGANRNAHTIVHTLDTVPGASGAPLIQEGKVVGVHIGYNSKVQVNVAIASDSYAVASIQDIAEDLSSEFKIKVPKKIGGSIGEAIGQVTNPIRDNVTAPLADAASDAIGSITRDIAKNLSPQLAAQSEREGWTTANCYTVGASAILLPAASYIAPACAASGFITAGIGVPACVTTVSGGIVAATCTQLCHDRHLVDCK